MQTPRTQTTETISNNTLCEVCEFFMQWNNESPHLVNVNIEINYFLMHTNYPNNILLCRFAGGLMVQLYYLGIPLKGAAGPLLR